MTDQDSPQTTITRLEHYGIIRAAGDDGFSFLQGQFGNDLAGVDESHHQLNCYSNPKGRLLAILRIFRRDQHYYLRMPGDIVTATLARLKMYLMMAKVDFQDVSDSEAGIGIGGDGAAGVIAAIGQSAPEHIGETISADGVSVLRVPGVEPRFELYAPRDRSQSIWADLEKHCETAGEDAWMHGELLAGMPNIYDSTREQFVAQMTNLQLIDGLSFKKGCFPGQEIVARMHYLGKLKRRMYLAEIDSNAAPRPGDNIFHRDDSSPVGQIVDARTISGQSPHALMVLKITAAESGDLHLGATDGPELKIVALPYEFDTAERAQRNDT